MARDWRDRTTLGLLVLSSTVSWTAAALAETTVSAQGLPAGEISKVACFTHHEDAQVARRQGRLLEARLGLRLCSSASCPAAIRADCVEWLDQLGRSLPSVVVTARVRGIDEAEVKVFIDGKLVAERLSGAALEVDPGQHRFRFESPRWPVVERTILVSEGVKDRAIDVEFAPPAPAPEAPPPQVDEATRLAPAAPRLSMDTVAYVLGAVGLAGLGTVVYFGGSALYDRQRLEGHCGPFCRPEEVNPVRTKLVVADVALGLGVVSLAVAFYLRFVRPPDAPLGATASRAGVSLSMSTTERGGGLTIGGEF